jgi:hypothetical protein
MNEGAIGFSTGLDYSSAVAAPIEEILPLAWPPPAAPAHSPATSYTPQPTYKRSGGNIARQLNQQELNRLQAAPINPQPLHY